MEEQQKRIILDSIIYDDKKMERRLKGIGEKIMRERMRQNMSISKLAELSNLSTSCISKVESARCRTSLRTLIKIAAALGVSVGAILDSEEDMDTFLSKDQETDKQASLTSGERFEQIMEDVGDGTVDFFLEMADDLIKIIGQERDI